MIPSQHFDSVPDMLWKHIYQSSSGLRRKAIIPPSEEEKKAENPVLYQANNNRNVISCLHKGFYLILNYMAMSNSIMAGFVSVLFLSSVWITTILVLSYCIGFDETATQIFVKQRLSNTGTTLNALCTSVIYCFSILYIVSLHLMQRLNT